MRGGHAPVDNWDTYNNSDREYEPENDAQRSAMMNAVKGFAIPRVDKRPELSLAQAKLLTMSMEQQGRGGGGQGMMMRGNEPSPWSKKASKKRSWDQQDTSWVTGWTSSYDRPLPSSVMNLVTATECKVCGVTFTNMLMGKQHYEGSKHEKKVRLELAEQCHEDEIPTKRSKTEGVENKRTENFLKKIQEEGLVTANNTSWGDQKLSELQQEISSKWDEPLPPQVIGLCQMSKCDVCEATFSSTIMAKSHYSGRKHEKKLVDTVKAFCDKNSLEMPKKKSDEASDGKATSEQVCKLCNVDLTSPTMAEMHYLGKQHRKRELSGISKSTTPEDSSGRFGIGGDFVQGEKENRPDNSEEEYLRKVFNDNKEDTDVNWGASPQNMEGGRGAGPQNKEGGNGLFSCAVCNVQTTSQITLTAHLAGKTHQKNLNKGAKPSSSEGSSIESFKCDLCTVECTGEATWKAHLESKKHNSRKQGNIVPGGFRCELCNISTTDQALLESHLSGKKHAAKAKKSSEENSS